MMSYHIDPEIVSWNSRLFRGLGDVSIIDVYKATGIPRATIGRVESLQHIYSKTEAFAFVYFIADNIPTSKLDVFLELLENKKYYSETVNLVGPAYDNPNLRIIQQNLRPLRYILGIKSTYLATAAGVGKSTIRNLERNDRRRALTPNMWRKIYPALAGFCNGDPEKLAILNSALTQVIEMPEIPRWAPAAPKNRKNNT